ncbi:MAG: ABC transporter permease, partial [Bacteroidetes bacterium]|nr:ABC transporter permease [Fibrella sp.]
MLRNYFKIAWRNLWRNRLYTTLNVVGLAIGLSACWIIYRLVSYEFAFDQHHANRDHIYRVVTRFNRDGQQSGFAGVPLPMVAAVQSQVPGIERVVPLREQWTNYVDVPQPTGKPVRFREVDHVVATSNDYFGLIHYKWLAGDVNQALARPGQVVLAQSRVERYFPGLTPRQVLGKTLTYFDTLTVRVAGVVADPNQPSSFGGREFLSLSTLPDHAMAGDWDNVNSADQLFVWLTAKTDAKQVAKRINDIAALHSESVRPKNGIRERKHPLQPLNDIHFGADIADSSRRASKGILYGLMGLAEFILLLAG